jgi:hypothetical protein
MAYGGKQDRTNVSRGPREVNLLTSIPGIFYLGKTNLRVSCDEYYMRCYGSLMGPMGRAICECSLVVVSLKGTRKVQQQVLIRLRERGRTFDLIYVVGNASHSHIDTLRRL